MKWVRSIGLVAALFASMFVVGHALYTYSFRPTEANPPAADFASIRNKTALVIVAHDDEAATMAGTVARLRSQGWIVDFLCFYRGLEPQMDAVRKGEAQQAAAIQQFRHVNLITLDMQKKPLHKLAIPYHEFDSTFRVDSISAVMRRVIIQSNPSILLTLDDVIGGYGHAEHVLVGKLAVRNAKQLNSTGLSNIQQVYQCVYPKSMADRMMYNQPIYKESQRIYGCDGMPSANVSVKIAEFSAEKMAALKSYASQHSNLKKFVKHYHLYPHWMYFRIFDREYFRMVPITSGTKVEGGE